MSILEEWFTQCQYCNARVLLLVPLPRPARLHRLTQQPSKHGHKQIGVGLTVQIASLPTCMAPVIQFFHLTVPAPGFLTRNRRHTKPMHSAKNLVPDFVTTCCE